MILCQFSIYCEYSVLFRLDYDYFYKNICLPGKPFSAKLAAKTKVALNEAI